jgi:hypothetical protein
MRVNDLICNFPGLYPVRFVLILLLALTIVSVGVT